MSEKFSESMVEDATLSWFEGLGWAVKNGPEIAPGETRAERQSYQETILPERLRNAIVKVNPQMPSEAIEEAFRKVSRVDSPSLNQSNQIFHRMLVNGVDVEYRSKDRVVNDIARLVDFENPDNNDWVAVNQFTVEEGQHNRRPDIVLFLNGLPVAVIELKNPADENATIWTAFNQLQTYKKQIFSLFRFNEILIISDGLEARFGSLTGNKEWFLPWRTIEGDVVAASSIPQLDVLVKGMFEKERFLQYLRYFVVFEEETKGVPIKKLAGYHQFHAVNVAVEETVRACRTVGKATEEEGNYYSKRLKGGEAGDKRVGVVWHTQGSGKSLTMAFYAGRVVQHSAMENPTLVVLTDRNDLDDQLYGTFSRCKELLRQTPAQATDRAHLRELLQVASGGVVFTTIQKFMPEEKGDRHPLLSDRSNIVVIADEAHRSQYDFIDGFARHLRDALPKASFIGFTGTPIELTDKNTRAVFGDYISIYDIQRAVQDGATVPIYYEGRLAKLELKEAEKPRLDNEFEDITEGEEEVHKEKLKTKWAALEAVVGSEKRVNLIARDIVSHFEARLEIMDGKAIIVCMSRRICVDLYNALVKLRPEWHEESDDKGFLKIVMSGSPTDHLDWQKHIRNKSRREAMAKRFKNPADPLKLVIVRDMWLTGFDAPCMHTLYADKPMRGHSLMQAIARVNRVFRDKPGGLVVDYLGLADFLRKALAVYTESGGKGDTAINQNEAVAVMMEKYEICCGLFHKFNWSLWVNGTPAQKLALLPTAQEHILAQEDGKNRLLKGVMDLSKAFALSVPNEKSIEIRDDVAFFQAVRAVLAKSGSLIPDKEEDMEHAIRQLISQAVASDKVIDIFAAAGLKKPDISVLSDEFLAEVRGLPQKNLAVELLRKLLNEEIRTQSRKNLIQSRLFSEMLEKTIRAYQNRALEAAQIIEQLIGLAKEMKQAQRRGEKLGLTEEEIAFYDALEVNDSAVKVMGDAALQLIARELVKIVRANVSIDWTVKESVRAKLRVMVKRILKQYGYPPDLQEKATRTVLEQAELIARDWVS
jgi:type I restriction enzyme R subunit